MINFILKNNYFFEKIKDNYKNEIKESSTYEQNING